MASSVDPGVLRSRFRGLAEMRRWEEAARVGLDWLAADPNSADAHAHQAWALVRCRQQEAAERHAREAFSLAPEWSWPPRLLAHAVALAGRWDEALALAMESLRIDSDDDQSHILAARCLCVLGRFDEARAHAQKAVALSPDDADHRRLLHSIEYVGKTSAADLWNRMQKLKAALALEPTNVDILRDLAMIHGRDLADHAAADELLRQAIEIDPSDSDLHEAREVLQAGRDAVYRTMSGAVAAVGGLRGPLIKPDSLGLDDLLAMVVAITLVMGCMLPIAAILYIPYKAYEWIVFAEHRSSRVRWPWLSRWLWRIGRLPLWVRRAIWAPLPTACIGLLLWLLPVPPALTFSFLACCLGVCVWISQRSVTQAHRNRQMLAQVVTADSADEIITAEPVEDVIRAELA